MLNLKTVQVLCLISALQLAADQQSLGSSVVTQQPTPSTNSTNIPYWRRPGCHRVGHTRIISIPGCLKFSISTNACRGYCMSYSIPVTEDLTPGAVSIVGEPQIDTDETGYRVHRTADSSQMARRGSTPSVLILPAGDLTDMLRPPRRLHQHWSSAVHAPASSNLQSDHAGQDDKANDRRDVVSFSQCCNMMQTEDRIVNVKCGVNETRKLVFKSAKSCECLFCKHV